jgi:hypothetical protein
MIKKTFSKAVESLVNPMEVGALQFLQTFPQKLPKSLQKKLVQSSADKIPYMGFVVEPYAFFLCYEIIDLEKAQALLPPGFDLIKTKIFEDDEPKYYCIFGCFKTHTSAFWGARVEFYVIAEDKKTGLLSWIIVDYDTNTLSYDNKNALRLPNSNKGLITINYSGRIFVDIKRDDKSRELVLDSEIERGKMKGLDQRLWLEGNLSIGYGRILSDGNVDIFSLKFDPGEVEKALQIPLDALNLESNQWYPGLFEAVPSQVLCFPYAQHFISDSPGRSSNLKNKEELVAEIESIDFENMEVFSTKSFKTMFIVGGAISALFTLSLILLLIFTRP